MVDEVSDACGRVAPDCFAGSGSSLIAALDSGGGKVIGIEKEARYVVIAKRRVACAKGERDRGGLLWPSEVSRQDTDARRVIIDGKLRQGADQPPWNRSSATGCAA